MKDKILLSHGSGSLLGRELIRKCFVDTLDNPLLAPLEDAAVFEGKGRMAFTTDSYVIHPLFFPGGDIGKLSVCGTVNDLSMMGAVPAYLSLSLIIEEGYEIAGLEKIVASIHAASIHAGVDIVTGDTKVVEYHKADGVFINTSGIGFIPPGIDVSTSHVQNGDKILVSGTLGDHGISVLACREGLAFETDIQSDCAPLNTMVARMLSASPNIHALRDPTRGGLAMVLTEIAEAADTGMIIEDRFLPVRPAVQTACDFLGLDPLHLANEGKLVAVVPPRDVQPVLSAMQNHEYGQYAAVIGEVVKDHPGTVVMKTRIGSHRIIRPPSGELLPRIC